MLPTHFLSVVVGPRYFSEQEILSTADRNRILDAVEDALEPVVNDQGGEKFWCVTMATLDAESLLWIQSKLADDAGQKQRAQEAAERHICLLNSQWPDDKLQTQLDRALTRAKIAFRLATCPTKRVGTRKKRYNVNKNRTPP